MGTVWRSAAFAGIHIASVKTGDGLRMNNIAAGRLKMRTSGLELRNRLMGCFLKEMDEESLLYSAEC